MSFVKIIFPISGLFFALAANAQIGGLLKDLSSISDAVKKNQVVNKAVEPAGKLPSSTSPSSSGSGVSVAATYPSEILGRYARGTSKKACSSAAKMEKLTGTWDGISIKPRETQNETILCEPLKVVAKEGSVHTSERCSNMGDEWETTAVYKLTGDALSVVYKGQQQDFVSCEKPKVAVPCNKDELPIVEESTGSKHASVCAYPKKPPFSKIEYRYGPKDGAELVYTADQKNGKKFFAAATTLSPTLDITYLWFSVGDVNYAVVDCSRGGCSTGGVVVGKGRKIISKQRFKLDMDHGFGLNQNTVFSFDSNYNFSTLTNLIENKYFPNESGLDALYE